MQNTLLLLFAACDIMESKPEPKQSPGKSVATPVPVAVECTVTAVRLPSRAGPFTGQTQTLPRKTPPTMAILTDMRVYANAANKKRDTTAGTDVPLSSKTGGYDKGLSRDGSAS
ncbi:MAG: hypothetical protein LBD79_06410 [Treponema sp.]|nr:hypothetical protein [Treponema sp.]